MLLLWNQRPKIPHLTYYNDEKNETGSDAVN